MGNIDKSQQKAVRNYLARQGITYEPLLDEMTDHIICDLEKRVQAGESYETAWQLVLEEIPPDRLKSIQIETMETISKKQTLSKWFAYLSFFLLFTGSAFKLLKFPGAGELFIASFYCIIISLLSGSIFGIYWNKEKTGGWLLMAIVVFIGIFLVSFTFQILHLPGATELRNIGVVGLCLLYPLSYFLLKMKRGTILPHLHEKYSPAIERFVMILFGAVVILRLPSIFMRYDDVVSRVLLVIVILALGLQFFSVMWHTGKRKTYSWLETAILSLSFCCFILPALVTILSIEARAALATVFFAGGGVVALLRSDVKDGSAALVGPVVLVVAVHIVWTLVIAGIAPGLGRLLHNAAVLIALVLCFYPVRKEAALRTYVAVAVSHYLFFYPGELGLW